MNKTLAVIRREIIARVRTRAFVLSTLFLPFLMVIMAVAPALMMRGTDRTMRLAMVDGGRDSLGLKIQARLTGEQFTHSGASLPRYDIVRIPAAGRVDAVRDSLVLQTGLSRRVAPVSLDGVLVITDSSLQSGKLDYFGNNASSFEAMGILERTLTQVIIGARLERTGVNPTVLSNALVPASLNTTKVSNGVATGQSGSTSFGIAYAMGFILYLTVIIYGQQTMVSVIEEKTSRIMEVLASSLRPFQMLLGKVIGVGLTGLLQIGIWGVTYVAITSQRGRLAGIFGLNADAIQQAAIPTMSGMLLGVFLAYFVLGFLLYGGLYAMIGSMCNSIREAQQYLMFVSIFLLMGFFSIFSLIKDPTSGMGVTMSMLPFFSQFAMPVRFSLAAVSPGKLAVSYAFGILALLGVTWLAAKVYRTGILMYGKKPTLRELFHWIRA